VDDEAAEWASELVAGVASPEPTADDLTYGGYWNADGTYHYTADNTDRDPETGAIVRSYDDPSCLDGHYRATADPGWAGSGLADDGWADSVAQRCEEEPTC
jgi:hypothetical protein